MVPPVEQEPTVLSIWSLVSQVMGIHYAWLGKKVSNAGFGISLNLNRFKNVFFAAKESVIIITI